jgi:hypothetical protein
MSSLRIPEFYSGSIKKIARVQGRINEIIRAHQHAELNRAEAKAGLNPTPTRAARLSYTLYVIS